MVLRKKQNIIKDDSEDDCDKKELNGTKSE